ncbi:hypothetical protein DFH11DRAFT_1556880 [Phellopilus nigrolimitatus]|nr:hypothetical protein DFH11DRAFT_1556880 [Phellopilus nigrolimitatus]
MDALLGLAKNFAESQQGESQQNQQGASQQADVTGGSHLNRPAGSQHDERGGSPGVDPHEAVRGAREHSEGDNSLFSSAMGFLKNNSSAKHEGIDEDAVTGAHDKAYNQNSSHELDASSLGSAAALQAFKSFTSGQSSHSGGGGDQKSQLISLAMSEASKLFNKGGSASGDKQDAINSAAMTVMKLLVKSKLSSSVGGENSGGLSSLMGLASKFA